VWCLRDEPFDHPCVFHESKGCVCGIRLDARESLPPEHISCPVTLSDLVGCVTCPIRKKQAEARTARLGWRQNLDRGWACAPWHSSLGDLGNPANQTQY